MTKTLTALIAAVTSAIATAAVPTTADARCPGCVGEPPSYAPPGYVYYSSYHEPLPQHPVIGTAFRSTTLTATWSAGAALRRHSAPG
jgi:hypothetical protein